MKNRNDSVGHFDGIGVSFPKDAVVTDVYFSGIGTVDVKSIQLKNDKKGITLSMDNYTWGKMNIFNKGLPASSTWTATFKYKKIRHFRLG